MKDKDGMEGTDIGAVPAPQRAYAAASREQAKFGLMVPEALLEASGTLAIAAMVTLLPN